MNSASEKSLNTLIKACGLSIGLRVVGGAEAEFRTSRAEKELPKLTCENSVAVRDDGLG